MFNYLDYNAAARSVDYAEIEEPSGSSFNELGSLISTPKFLIIFPPLVSGESREGERRLARADVYPLLNPLSAVVQRAIM